MSKDETKPLLGGVVYAPDYESKPEPLYPRESRSQWAEPSKAIGELEAEVACVRWASEVNEANYREAMEKLKAAEEQLQVERERARAAEQQRGDLAESVFVEEYENATLTEENARLKLEVAQLRYSVAIHNAALGRNATDACSGQSGCWCDAHAGKPLAVVTERDALRARVAEAERLLGDLTGRALRAAQKLAFEGRGSWAEVDWLKESATQARAFLAPSERPAANTTHMRSVPGEAAGVVDFVPLAPSEQKVPKHSKCPSCGGARATRYYAPDGREYVNCPDCPPVRGGP